MAIIRTKDIVKMPEKEKQERLKELKLELIRANVAANKTGKIKIKELRKTIAKLLMFTAKMPENK